MKQCHQTKANSPRQPYVTQEALLLVRFRTFVRGRLRDCKAHQRLHLLSVVFSAWRQREAVVAASSRLHLQEACAARALAITAKELQQLLRAGKKAYLTGLAKRFSGDAHGRKWTELWKSLSCLRPNHGKRRKLHPLLSVKSADGRVLQDHEEVSRRWSQHFGEIEGGNPCSISELGRQHASSATSAVVPLRDLPTRLQWESTFRGLASGKAPGPDGVTADFVKLDVAKFAATSYSLCLKAAYTQCEPLRWRGGTAFPLWKGKRSEQLCSSYRSILVSELLSKRFHSWLRKDLSSCFDRTRTVGQCGITGGSTCSMLSLWVRSAQRYLTDSKCSHGILFTDIVSAFYSTLRQFVVGVSDFHSFATWCRNKGVAEDGLDAISAALLTDVAQLSPVLSGIQKRRLADVLRGTWFIVQGSDLPVGTERGTRPGDPLADLIYGLVMAGALREIESRMIQAHLVPRIALAGALPHHTPGDVLCAPSVAWHDDAAFVFSCASACDLRHAAARTAGIVWDAFQSRGLTLSFELDKSELLLSPQGKGSDSVRHELFAGDTPCVYFLPDTGCMQKVGIVRTYVHLGSCIDAAQGLTSDIRRRLLLATEAAKPLARAVFRNIGVPLDVRATLFRSLVLSRLTHNIGAWSGLTKTEQAAWQKGCMRLYKYLLPARLASDHLDSGTICARTSMPAPLHLVRFERLRLLGQCASKGFGSLLHLLEGTIGSSQCWLSEAMSDVRWLVDLRPTPNALTLRGLDVHELFITLQGQPTSLPGLLKPAWFCSVKAITSQDFVQFADSARTSEHCHLCGKVCKGRQGLQVHLARKHGVLMAARFYAPDHTCQACRKAFANRERVLKHLSRRSPACLRFLQLHRTPLTEQEERSVTKAEAKWRSKPQLQELSRADGHRFAIFAQS